MGESQSEKKGIKHQPEDADMQTGAEQKNYKKVFAISKVLAWSAFTMFFREKVLMAENRNFNPDGLQERR